jgi:hypothetical protein
MRAARLAILTLLVSQQQGGAWELKLHIYMCCMFCFTAATALAMQCNADCKLYTDCITKHRLYLQALRADCISRHCIVRH